MIQTLVNGFKWLFQSLYNLLVALFGAFLEFFNFVGEWMVTLIANVVAVCVDVAAYIIVGLLALFPGVPALPDSVGFNVLSAANRYFPVFELAGYGILWGGVFGAISLIKFAKFVRGGG
jgi:hypothetical protein